jgi:chromosome partitioning protein
MRKSPMPSDDELMGLSEVAELLGVTRQTVANWRSRGKDFPQPTADLRSGPIWTRSAIIRWAADNSIEVRETPAGTEQDGAHAGATTVSIVNMKGGVGKSTLTANLGWFCAYKENQRVLLIDLDPQFNLSQYAMGTDGYTAHLDSGKGTVLHLFEQLTPTAVSGKERVRVEPTEIIARIKSWTDGSRIDLIPSSLELAWTLKNPHQKEHLLTQFLDEVRSSYDLILIDCPPTESMLTTAAYLASDSVLVPVKPEFLSTIGLPLVFKSLEEFERTYNNRTLEVLGIVFNASSDKLEHDRSRTYVRNVANQYGWYVFKNEISFSDSYPKGSRIGKPIFLTDYARYYKIEDFYNVANEFMARINS